MGFLLTYDAIEQLRHFDDVAEDDVWLRRLLERGLKFWRLH